MKKYIILSILPILFTLSPSNSSYITASESTFTIPSGNSSDTGSSGSTDDEYHKYNIENKNPETINKYNMQNNKTINKKNNSSNNTKNNSGTYRNNSNNNQNSNITKPYNTKIPESKKNNYNNNQNNFNNNKTKKRTNNKTANNKTTTSKTTSNKTTGNKTTTSKTTSNKTTITNSIIEFSKHFIKIPVGKTINISLKTNPKNLSYKNIIYKSNDNSVATFKNNKITGIKKGFTTIILTLQDGTIKAACPVKVI